MVEKIEAAVDARTDPDFLIIARTGAVRNESYEAAVARGRAYREAGADLIMLFPGEAEQWTRAPTDIGAPLAAMGAFGARTREEWSTLGWPLVIDPVQRPGARLRRHARCAPALSRWRATLATRPAS